MKKVIRSITILFTFVAGFQQVFSQNEISKPMKTFFDFKAKTIDEKEYDFSSLKGKKILVVNTASECGYTPQYADLEKLFKQFGAEKFMIIGFPANNFGSQEPGTNKEIAEFCKKNYDVSFLMFEKISVKGNDIYPIYQWLTQKSENGVADVEVKWNFQKFLIDENGKLVKSIPHKENPMSEEIINWLKK